MGAPGRAGKTKPKMPAITNKTAKIQSKISIYMSKTAIAAVNDHGIA